jgi:hypothetical protein
MTQAGFFRAAGFTTYPDMANAFRGALWPATPVCGQVAPALIRDPIPTFWPKNCNIIYYIVVCI